MGDGAATLRSGHFTSWRRGPFSSLRAPGDVLGVLQREPFDRISQAIKRDRLRGLRAAFSPDGFRAPSWALTLGGPHHNSTLC